jgi:two-component system chemotaxis sensor kinase CheA
MDDILAEFIAETRETLEALSGELVAWETDPDDRDRLDAIFRFVHTVKGSCGFLNLDRLERLSHAAEDALSQVREGTRTADRALVSAVLAIVDRIAELAEALDTGEAVHGSDDHLIAAVAIDGAVVQLPADTQSPAQRGATRSIRISLDLLDRMMAGVSDLVLARNELSRRLQDADAEAIVEGAFERLSACVADMRDTITRTRMQRIEKLFASVPRLVRDLATELGKPVGLRIEGGDVELDREMIELIRDPLTHIVRNALDHGIELPDERARAGKPAEGRLRIMACQSGNQIVIEVADDGRGIDADRLVARAVAAGIVTVERAERLSHEARLALAFEPGLSTARTVTALSGRGVGMDVVRANIERIGGVVDITSIAGKGVTLTLRMPLTLSIIPALAVGSGGHHFAVPRAAIREIVRDNNASLAIERVGSATIARLRDERIPVVELEEILGIDHVAQSTPRSLIILNPAGGATYALSVADLHDHQELVIRPACPTIMAAGVYAGMTLPDTGVPMLLLDPAGIADAAGIVAVAAVDTGEEDKAAVEEPGISTLLFRDLDGVERAVRLSVVERIEEVAGDQIRFGAGRLRLAVDDRIIPLVGFDTLTDRQTVSVLRLNDGTVELAYAIDEVIDIVRLSGAPAQARSEGIVAGVALLDGRQIEILDPHWLFADAVGSAPAGAERPLCLLGDRDDPWTREVLRPLVEAAGYRVAFDGDAVEGDAQIVIASEGSAAETRAPQGRLLRLRSDIGARDADPGSVYRYDRAGLMTALQAGRSRMGG